MRCHRWLSCDPDGEKLIRDGRRTLARLVSDSLTEVVYKNSSVSGQRLPTQRSDILIHVCTHAQFTTAQVVNMMRHAGVEQLPDSMLITLARQES